MPEKLPEVPKIVNKIADLEGRVPWSWFVADDHVTIVWVGGIKIRYDLPFAGKYPAAPSGAAAARRSAAAAHPAAAAPSRSRSNHKK